MDRMKLPKPLQDRIFYYYEYLFREHGTLDGSVIGFVPEVSKKLQAEMYLWQRFNLIKSVPFFQKIHPKVIQDIVIDLTVEVYLPGDFIISHNDFGDSMYFLYTGQCEVIIPITKKMEDLAKERRRSTDNGKRGGKAGAKDDQKQQPIRKKSSVTSMLSGLGAFNREKKDTIEVESPEDSIMRLSEGLSERVSEPRVSSGRFSNDRVLDSWGGDPPPSVRISGTSSSSAIESKPSSSGFLREKLGLGHGKGEGNVVKRPKPKYKIVAVLKAGQYFGEVALVLHSRRTASIRSKGCCEVCVLNKTTYEKTAKEYPKDAEIMRNVILSKYGHLDHSKKEVFLTVQKETAEKAKSLEDEKSKTEGDLRGLTEQRPSMNSKDKGSSRSTIASTPSTTMSMSRANSNIEVTELDSPTRGLKTAVSKMRAEVNLIQFQCDKIVEEELNTKKALDVIEEQIIMEIEALRAAE